MWNRARKARTAGNVKGLWEKEGEEVTLGWNIELNDLCKDLFPCYSFIQLQDHLFKTLHTTGIIVD